MYTCSMSLPYNYMHGDEAVGNSTLSLEGDFDKILTGKSTCDSIVYLMLAPVTMTCQVILVEGVGGMGKTSLAVLPVC